MLMESNILLTMYSLHLENLFDILNAMIHTGISSELRTKLRTWAICGRPGLAATLRQHCPQMTQRRCKRRFIHPLESHSKQILVHGIGGKTYVSLYYTSGGKRKKDYQEFSAE